MSKFNKDMRVVVIDEHNYVRKGVIDKVFDSMDIAIVKFDDGNVEKVHFSYLGIEPETKAQGEPKKTNEPIEKSEITITPEEFQKIAVGVVRDITEKSGPALGFASTLIISLIHKALFLDEGDNA